MHVVAYIRAQHGLGAGESPGRWVGRWVGTREYPEYPRVRHVAECPQRGVPAPAIWHVIWHVGEPDACSARGRPVAAQMRKRNGVSPVAAQMWNGVSPPSVGRSSRCQPRRPTLRARSPRGGTPPSSLRVSWPCPQHAACRHGPHVAFALATSAPGPGLAAATSAPGPGLAAATSAPGPMLAAATSAPGPVNTGCAEAPSLASGRCGLCSRGTTNVPLDVAVHDALSVQVLQPCDRAG